MKKIVIISDTHGEHNGMEIPECDILIHCGDSTSMGKEHSVIEFLDWFSKQEQCKNKVFIAGNHDFYFERAREKALKLIPSNVIYLEDELKEIEGLKIYGSPVQPVFHNWAFNRTEEQLFEHWKNIPEGIDILITHGPPCGIMDVSPWSKTHIGSPSLCSEVINRIKPKIHCFGHLHNDYGILELEGIKFINASNLNEEYDIANKPIVVEL